MTTGRSGVWLALLGMGVVLMTQRGKPIGPKPGLDASLDKLAPSFRVKIDQLLGLMRAAGFRPIVWESHRSAARAAELAKAGTGVAKSQHTLDLAVDILDQDALWNTPQAFFDALHSFALGLGLGRVKHRDKNGRLDWDWAHVQALPGRYDAALFKLADAAAREAYIRNLYQA